MEQQRRKSMLWTILSGVLLVVLFVVLWFSISGQAKQITRTEFKENIGSYTRITIKIYTVTAENEKGQKFMFTEAVGNNVSELNDWIQEQIAANKTNPKLEYKVDNSTSNIWDILYPLLSLALVIGLGVYLMRSFARQNNQNMDFGRSREHAIKNINVLFADVAGADEEKEELQEIIDFLKNPQKYNDIGARIPHGVLLVGPPGTGKTLFAKAVAGEAGVPFFSISGSDFVEMFVGVGASRVRDLFDQAKKNMPCIIFIDEIDAVGRQRGAGLGGGHDEKEQTLNQLLVEMDGFESNTNIIVMAATNRADILDPALVRPGRFDRQIFVNRPDVRGREAILKVHSRKKPIAPDVNFRQVARITAGFTGADLENLLNEAAILAVRDGRKLITMADINEGINKVVMGPAKKSRLVTEPDKRITAYHEAGHAIIGSVLKYCDPIHEVTIIPRGQAAGYTMSRPDNDNSHVSRQELLDDITMGLGGRVAEELVIKNYCTGASGDIKMITDKARSMVTEWGMSDRIGPIYYGSNGEIFVGRDYQTEKGYSEEIAGVIDEEVRAIIESCHQRATQILTEKLDVLHNMARVLVERETIHTEEVEMLVKGATVEEVFAYMDKADNAEQGNAEVKPVAKQPTADNATETVDNATQTATTEEPKQADKQDDQDNNK